MLVLLLISMAQAGKLADGWRGLAYGANPAVTQAAPRPEGCVAGADHTRWLCTELIGAQPFTVAYMVSEGLYLGVFIRCENFAECQVLHDTVQAAWGALRPKFESDHSALADGFWFDGRAGASWTFNRYSGKGQLTTTDLDVADQADAIQRARAAKAAESL